MEWRDDGLIIGTRKHGETSVIVEAMTRAHGRHFGLVRGGRSKRMQPLLQPGNHAELVWRARLDEHLGTFLVEPVKLRTARLMASAEALHAVCLIAALLRLGPERDPHPALYETAMRIADGIDRPEILPPLIVRFEAKILAQMGFGLDLETCAATGATNDLIYVSPKSGRAVSKAAGEPYKSRLLPLPAFLRSRIAAEDLSHADIWDGFRLTGFFLMCDLFGPRGQTLPEARGAYLAELAKRFGSAARTSQPI
ncbi:MAG: DNA repair protein RecO [Pseudomonadota bacterium]|nr:DNA repair protein RecO [Pseudomonadota bacterium]